MNNYPASKDSANNRYLDLRSQIRAKLDERKALRAELDGLGLLSIGRRKELKTRLAALAEEIEELRFEEKSIMQGFDKEDAAGMKQVKSEISGAETDMIRLGKDETALNDAIKKEREKFTGLKEQAAELAQGELTDARLALRPKMEAQAQDRIRGAMSSGKIDFWKFQATLRDTDTLLSEDGLAEQRDLEKRREEQKSAYKPQTLKPRSQDLEY